MKAQFLLADRASLGSPAPGVGIMINAKMGSAVHLPRVGLRPVQKKIGFSRRKPSTIF